MSAQVSSWFYLEVGKVAIGVFIWKERGRIIRVSIIAGLPVYTLVRPVVAGQKNRLIWGEGAEIKSNVVLHRCHLDQSHVLARLRSSPASGYSRWLELLTPTSDSIFFESISQHLFQNNIIVLLISETPIHLLNLFLQSKILRDDLYILQWHKLDVRNRKIFLNFQVGITNPVIVKAGGLVDMSMDTFSSVSE